MTGLECSEVRYSHVLTSAQTKRFDPEYYQKQYLRDEQYAAAAPERFCSFSQLGLRVDASAFYPSIEPFYGEGDFPFLRVGDVDTVIDFQKCIRIPAKLCEDLPTLRTVSLGDIVFTKGGSVARIGLVTQPAAASRDLIFLDSHLMSESDRVFLYLYFQTDFFNRQLVRSSSQTAQPHLTITLVRNLPVFNGSQAIKRECVSLVRRAYELRALAIAEQQRADEVFANALGVDTWSPPDTPFDVRTASDIRADGRLDAEHYREKYYAARRRLTQAGAEAFVPLSKLLVEITNGHTPLHHDLDIGEVPFLCAEHVGDFEIDFHSAKHILMDHHRGELSRTALRDGDVLLTIKGRIGNAALVEDLKRPTNINQDVALLRLNHQFPVWYVLAFLNSSFGKLAVEQMSTGGINPFLGLANVRRLMIPKIQRAAMEQIGSAAQQHVAEAKRYRTESEALLDRAKRAVEIAIEGGDAVCLEFLVGEALSN